VIDWVAVVYEEGWQQSDNDNNDNNNEDSRRSERARERGCGVWRRASAAVA